MQRKIIYVNFVKKRRITFLGFIVNRITSYIHVKLHLKNVPSSCTVKNNESMPILYNQIDYYKLK
ncbi:hypothetical protein SAMN05421842_103155 [Clostridium uliginosum]|uniref:Uncharacterized protein n=1 Tax=Clostridium uliginosum TaxID=119641 RepID=A0A1I1J1K9_9CLOT|nr:hypothetical protein SAMN05421842_103155 [Clostridium uliginosum]